MAHQPTYLSTELKYHRHLPEWKITDATEWFSYRTTEEHRIYMSSQHNFFRCDDFPRFRIYGIGHYQPRITDLSAFLYRNMESGHLCQQNLCIFHGRRRPRLLPKILRPR